MRPIKNIFYSTSLAHALVRSRQLFPEALYAEGQIGQGNAPPKRQTLCVSRQKKKKNRASAVRESAPRTHFVFPGDFRAVTLRPGCFSMKLMVWKTLSFTAWAAICSSVASNDIRETSGTSVIPIQTRDCFARAPPCPGRGLSKQSAT